MLQKTLAAQFLKLFHQKGKDQQNHPLDVGGKKIYYINSHHFLPTYLITMRTKGGSYRQITNRTAAVNNFFDGMSHGEK
jgi:hypothetical protein